MNKRDELNEKYLCNQMVGKAKRVLEAADQSEEEFLGAQAVFLLNGLI
ncbi:MAG: hypothetical protein KTR14_07310 [Vampirovibrio sp.]|nr:hypothetical protein [Vampirovibrio sp.]